ncbi:hypothetical protein ACPV5L_07485 [Vibrio astriarenae]
MKRKTRTNQAGEQIDYQACDVLDLMIRKYINEQASKAVVVTQGGAVLQLS